MKPISTNGIQILKEGINKTIQPTTRMVYWRVFCEYCLVLFHRLRACVNCDTILSFIDNITLSSTRLLILCLFVVSLLFIAFLLQYSPVLRRTNTSSSSIFITIQTPNILIRIESSYKLSLSISIYVPKSVCDEIRLFFTSKSLQLNYAATHQFHLHFYIFMFI